MPLSPADPIVVQLGWKIILDGFVLSFGRLGDDFLKLTIDLERAFPNPYRMVDVLVQFYSGLTGRLLGVPFAGIEAQILKLISWTGYGSRVLTLNSAVRMQAACFREIMLNITGTSENGLVTALLMSVARWVWALRTRYKLLRLLIRASSFEQFFQDWVVRRLTSKAKFYGVALLVVVFFSIIAWIGTVASLLGIVLMVLTGALPKFLLPQDSSRAWRRRGGMARVNRRVGPDQ
jgi:hypothetical protein